jgi:hypothetical protein
VNGTENHRTGPRNALPLEKKLMPVVKIPYRVVTGRFLSEKGVATFIQQFHGTLEKA